MLCLVTVLLGVIFVLNTYLLLTAPNTEWGKTKLATSCIQ